LIEDYQTPSKSVTIWSLDIFITFIFPMLFTFTERQWFITLLQHEHF